MKRGKKAAIAATTKPVLKETKINVDEDSWKNFGDSDDEIKINNGSDDDNDAHVNTEVMALADSDEDEDSLPQDSSRWDRIRDKKLAELERQSKSWGKLREDYYDADNASEYNKDEQEMVERIEEREAIKIQREQAKALSEHDFGLADVLAAAKKTSGAAAGAAAGKKSAKAAAAAAAAAGGDLTKDEKVRQVIADSPELLALLDEYTTRVKELRVEVQPLLERVRAAAAAGVAGATDLATKDGISFLELKHQLLVSYCVNLAFYLLLRTEGRSVASHPVVKRLVHIRVTLEKMRPVDKQLRYQVQKLLKAGALGAGSNTTVADAAAAAAAAAAAVPATGAAMLGYKPSLAAMAATVTAGKKSGKKALSALGDGGSDEEMGSDDEAAAGTASRGSRLLGAAAIAHDTAMAKLAGRAAAEKERRARRAAGSQLIQELRREMSDRPEEETTGALRLAKLDQFDKDRREFEEAHYMRLNDTKESKKRRKQAEQISVMDAFDDFADLNEIVHVEKRARADAERNARALAELRARRPGQIGDGLSDDDGGDDDGDDDGYENDRGAGGGAHTQEDFNDADTQYYEALKEAAAQRSASAKTKQLLAEAEYEIKHDERDLAEQGERRHIGAEIMKNRGLIVNRPSKYKSVRTQSRHRASVAEGKAKSQVQRYKGKQGDEYSGESRGINKNVVRSHRFAK